MNRLLFLSFLLALIASAQESRPPGPPRRPGGFGGGVREETKLLKQFDKNGNKRLDLAERNAAREFLQKEIAEGRGPNRPGRRRPSEPIEVKPGPKLSPADVKNFTEAPLYDLNTLRTFFLEFENAEWSRELADFYKTDVEVSAKLIVDGKTYPEVGVHYRGASSFFTVPEGQKRSLNISIDFAHDDQSLGGYGTLNLLNSHRDPTYVRTILYYHIANQYLPAPKANYARLVVNGESWGPYINAQQFNKEFIQEHFGTTKGARWKVPGSPGASGGLEYLGEDPAPYKRLYEIKTKDDPKSWAGLIKLCRALKNADVNNFEKDLAPILDIDGVLKFLALENTLINSDGYWIRSSDYNIYQDEKGRFHIIPHDANETFAAPEGPGNRGGGEAISGVELPPDKGVSDPSKPLLNKLLAIAPLKARYHGYVRHIAENWLDWAKIGPLAQQLQAVIAADIKTDTRKLESEEAFRTGLTEDAGRRLSLKSFVEQRRAYLLSLPQVKDATLPAKL